MHAIRKSSVLAALLLGLFVSSARAQGVIAVKVPFPFMIGHQSFPAGQYDVRTADIGDATMSITSKNNRSAGFLVTIPATGGDPAGDRPALVFTRHEKEYRLSQIWESGREGRELPGSRSKAIGRSETQTESDTLVYVVQADWK